jgi:hypothetical protein
MGRVRMLTGAWCAAILCTACVDQGKRADSAGANDTGEPAPAPAQSAPVERPPTRQSTLTLRRHGGIAGLTTEITVDGRQASYVAVTRPACAPTALCPPTDSASGALSPEALESVFDSVAAGKFFELRDDYGATPNAADMFIYELVVRMGDQVKTVRGDDGSRPEGLRRMEEHIQRTIESARGRGG